MDVDDKLKASDSAGEAEETVQTITSPGTQSTAQ